MRISFLFFIVVFLGSLSAAGQKPAGNIRGILTDTASRQSLAGATVSVIFIKDSAMAAYLLSDKKGMFEIGNLANDSYKLIITFQGYQSYQKRFSINATRQSIDLGRIILKKDFHTLDTFVVETDVPIQIKGDTVQFNAGAFKTVPNANAEDLLKKLPGVEVDADGNVKAQGEDVTKIYVDGKEFFGKDPKMATKNITADMIQSVQVYDDMSDQAKFTRIDDGSRSKTINIVLKKDRRKGYFGRAIAGVGDNDRYQSTLTFNRFDDTRRISFVGNSNNINKQAFSSNDIVSRMGGFTGGGGGRNTAPRTGGNGTRVATPTGPTGNGLTTSSSAGINYIDKIGKKIDVTGSYNFSETNNKKEQTSYRESTFFNDSSATENSSSLSNNINRNQQFNLRMEYYIDSMNSILYTPGISFQHSDSYTEDSSSTMAVKPSLKYLSNSNNGRYTSERDGVSINNEVLFRRRFKKQGRTFTLGYSNATERSNGSGTNISPIIFYNPDGTVSTVIDQNFENAQNTRSNSNVITSSFTEMFGKNKILELNYAYTNKHSTSDKDAYDYDPVSKAFDLINRQQTNSFENVFIAHRYGGNFRVLMTKYNFQIGTAVQTSQIDNRSIRGIYQNNGKDSVIYTKQNFTNLFPTANFTYNFSKKTNLIIHYRGRTNQPSVAQLQDVPDLTNLLRISVGNPLLKQEFGHTVDVSFKTINTATYKYLNITINGSETSNHIVNSTDSLTLQSLKALGLPDSLLRPGVQLIRPLNLNGAFNVSSNITVGVPFNKLKGSSVNFTNSVNYNHSLSMLYKQLNTTNTLTVSQSAGINLDIKSKFNIGLRAKVSYSQAKYSIAAGNNNTNYYTQSYSTDMTYYITKSFIISTDFDYLLYTGQSAGFNQSIPLWNANLAKQFFKKKNGELKFSVNDLLNQNQSITRTQGENYYYDSRTVVLQRYFLLTFTYNLNKFGGKRPPGMNNNRQRGNEMGGRRNNNSF
ncbi:MAG: outer membrane beta-barrel protein [Ferruginibacter sp.]